MESKRKIKKKTIAIIAPTGMLGSMVYNILKEKYDLVLIYRDKEKLKKLNTAYGGLKEHKKIQFDLSSLYQDYVDGFPTLHQNRRIKKLVSDIGTVSAVINCAGITKPHSLINPAITCFINGMVPHIFSTIYTDKFIQITSDCVFSGINGAPYKETSPISATDLYGLSKSMGEPQEKSLVLRTSIIGPEIEGFSLFIEWFRRQDGKTVTGFTNHIWNGITTKQFALICDRIISHRKDFPKQGLFHIFSTSVTKYEMLQIFKKKYDINATILAKHADPIDRRLGTIHAVCKKLQIPSFQQMMNDL